MDATVAPVQAQGAIADRDIADRGIADRFREEERYLFALCYRMTGSTADAEDLVQETFVRAMERPPARQGDPWRPWLVTVAMNLCKDALRKRRRRRYVGPWLPAPIEAEDEPPAWEAPGPGGTEHRYDLLESVSFAFLLALEALTPQQRAVLVLRDVLDYSVKETADALGLSEPNVKTTHHRARKALGPYDACRSPRAPDLAERTRTALVTFFSMLATGDVAAVEALLAEDARAVNDGGGEVLAALVPVTGRKKVAKLMLGLARHAPPGVRVELRAINGLPAFVIEASPTRARIGARYVIRCEIDDRGAITALYTVLAPNKLRRVRPLSA
jgi:RNA polymerase sigma-70 factor, ECF subfamily